MRKWIRRSLYAIGILALLAGVALFIGYRLFNATPDWYRTDALSEAQRQEAARSATNKLLAFRGQAVDARMAVRRGPDAATRPAAPLPVFEVEFSNEELNAFFQDWIKRENRDRTISEHLANPQIVLRGRELILAGTLRGVEKLDGRVVSAHFEPKLDARGNVEMDLMGLWMGYLPLPNGVWAEQRTKLVALLEQGMPEMRREARMDESGLSNGRAMAAALGQLLLDVLNDRPADPTLFIPLDGDSGIAVKLTRLSIDDGVLTIQATPLDGEERDQMMRRLKVE